MPLSKILCWPIQIIPPPTDGSPQNSSVAPGDLTFVADFHPDSVAARLQLARDHRREVAGKVVEPETKYTRIEASSGIPESIQRAIRGQVTLAERKELKRPRVIMSTTTVQDTDTTTEG